MLDFVAVGTIEECKEADNFLQKFETAIDRDYECLVRTFWSNDFEERFLGGNAVRLFDQSQSQSIDVVD